MTTVKYRKDNWDTNIQYTRQIFQHVDTNIAWAKTFSTFIKNIALQKNCKNDQFSTKNFSHFLCLKSVGSFQLNSVNGRNRCYEIFSNFTIGLFLWQKYFLKISAHISIQCHPIAVKSFRNCSKVLSENFCFKYFFNIQEPLISDSLCC